MGIICSMNTRNPRPRRHNGRCQRRASHNRGIRRPPGVRFPRRTRRPPGVRSPRRTRRPRGKLRGRGGMSMLETLLAMMILGLASLGMSTGVMFANVQFTRSMLRSQSKVLYSTLQSIIQVELAYTGDRGESSKIKVSPIGGASGRYKLEAFRSTFFVPDESADQLSSFVVTTESGSPQVSPADGRAYGNLALQAEGDAPLPLVSTKTVYTEGMGASVQITYADKQDMPSYVPAHFTVELRIYDKRGDILQQGAFDVIPLREPEVVF